MEKDDGAWLPLLEEGRGRGLILSSCKRNPAGKVYR